MKGWCECIKAVIKEEDWGKNKREIARCEKRRREEKEERSGEYFINRDGVEKIRKTEKTRRQDTRGMEGGEGRIRRPCIGSGCKQKAFSNSFQLNVNIYFGLCLCNFGGYINIHQSIFC